MQPLKTYHLYTHANGSENFFRNDDNYQYFLKRYEDFIPPIANTLAWCLMPNHIHYLIQIKSEVELLKLYNERYPDETLRGFQTLEELKTIEEFVIRQFSHLFNAYTQAYNKMYKRRGSLFIHSFKRKEIDSSDYFTSIVNYIHTNPIKHGFASSVTDWRWCSYHQFLLPKVNPVQQQVIDWFGGLNQFIEFHKQPVNKLFEL